MRLVQRLRAIAPTLALALTLALAACMPTQQRMHARPDEFAGPAFDLYAGIFTTFDGAPLGLSVWQPPEGAPPWAAMLALHGVNDAAPTFDQAARWFAANGVVVYGYDARGFGRSPRRGIWPGHRLMVEDVRTAAMLVRARHPDLLLAVLGSSMGAAEAIIAFGADDHPPIDRLVLASPALVGWEHLPDGYGVAIGVGAHTAPWFRVAPSRRQMERSRVSDNPLVIEQLANDPLRIRRMRIDALYGLVIMMERARAHVDDIKTPAVVLYGAHDLIVPRTAVESAVAAMPPHARSVLYENGHHTLLRDRQAEIVYTDILAFLRDPHAPFPSGGPAIAPTMAASER